MIQVEFDPGKSMANKRKHGVDFEDAQSLWDDPAAVEIGVKLTGEPRTMIIGKIDAKHWSAIMTRRSGAVRLISVRRSRKEEVAVYENL